MNNPPVIDAIRRLVGSPSDNASDGELLARFVASRDGQAFETLVRRYGGLVWGACRRRLKDAHAAEDAFQTTFLALSRHAGSIRNAEALGAWLHRTAVRCTSALRNPRGIMLAEPPDVPVRGPDPVAMAATKEMEEIIDAEIDALPEPFRKTFVLCEVQQRSASEAAKTLGCAVGTVESRLTRARQRLKVRLARRGVIVSTFASFAFLADAVPASARSGAVSMAIGASPVPAMMAVTADQSVRFSMATVMGVGIGVSLTIGLVGVGTLIWGFIHVPKNGIESVASTQMVRQAPMPFPATRELPIPETDQFRRNRDNFPLPPEAIARVGNAWLRHGATPTSLTFSSDGRFVATACKHDRWVRVWDLQNAKPRAHLQLAANETLLTMVLSSDGGSLKAVVQSGTSAVHLREYDTFRAAETRRRLLENGPVETVAIHPSGSHVATANAGVLNVYETRRLDREWKATLPTPKKVELTFSSTGNSLATIEAGGESLRVHRLDDGKILGDWTDRGASLSMLRISSDGARLATWCAERNSVRVWNVEDRKLLRSIESKQPVTGLAFAPNGDRVVGFSENRPATSWSVNGKDKTLIGYDATGGSTGWYSSDGSMLATTAPAGAVVLLEATTMTLAAASPRDPFTPTPAGFGSDGRRLLVEYFQTWLEHPTEGETLPRELAPGIGPNETSVMSAGNRSAVSPDRGLIARCTVKDSAKREFTIDLVDPVSQEVRRQIPLKFVAHRPAFSPDGKTLFAYVGDKRIHAWDVATGEERMRTDEEQTGFVSRLLVSPDGRYVTAAQMVFGPQTRLESIRVFDAATGRVLLSANGMKGEPRIAFSGDGKFFAAIVGSERAGAPPTELRVWETATGRERLSLSGYVGQPSFSPDARTLAINQDDGVVLIELASAKTRHAFQHHGPVEPAISWRGDGRVLASSSPEAPVYLWDVCGDRTGVRPGWEKQHDENRWLSLVNAEPTNAFGALRQLWSNPNEAVEFLKERMTDKADARLASRGCEALEMIRNTEALKLLTAWATGKPQAALTIEAKESLKRLNKSF